jgi:hypothetical protein
VRHDIDTTCVNVQLNKIRYGEERRTVIGLREFATDFIKNHAELSVRVVEGLDGLPLSQQVSGWVGVFHFLNTCAVV